MSERSFSRREILAALASITALPLVSACGSDRAPAVAPTNATAANDVKALALLDEVADSLIHLLPEQATSLGIDTGAKAALRSLLTDR